MTKALKLISLMAVALLLMGGEFSCHVSWCSSTTTRVPPVSGSMASTFR